MKDILTGKTANHLTPGLGGFLFAPEAAQAIERLAKRALAQGFELKITSSFRDFERQKNIWNAKASGQRVLLDSHGEPLDFQTLNEDQVIDAIMRWSAFPGASRHHWGTDVDVYDGKAVSADYQVQLTPQEVSGVFAPFYSWLDQLIASDDAEGFYRPYDQDRGGVAPEAWHLSYRPLASQYEHAYSSEFFLEHLNLLNDVLLVEQVKKRADEIHARYISNVAT